MKKIGEMEYGEFIEMFEQHRDQTGMSIPKQWSEEVFRKIYDFLAYIDPSWYPDAYSIYGDFAVYEPNAFLAEYNYLYPEFVKYMRQTHEERLEGVLDLLSEKTVVWKLDNGDYLVYLKF